MSRSPDKETLEATLRRAAAGDESAWRTIVDTYTPRVYGLLVAQCRNADLAEEIAQSAFCTIAARIDQYTELGRFEAWLFRIAMNRLRDEMRRRRRQAQPVEEQALAGLAGASENPRENPHDDHLPALREALSMLSDADRRVIQLRHYADLSFARIAQVLGEPLGTVLARQHRALKKLRQLIEARATDSDSSSRGGDPQ